ncbi:MAG: NifB/NifX family molybdenum-iron cluster-binding protein [Candidatus Hodarchaeales archaeon]
MKIAIPTFSPGGLDSTINAHFGKCDSVTFVTIEDGKIVDSAVAVPQGAHSCGTLPDMFAENKADACIVSGIGGRPFMFLQQYGIKTFVINPDMANKPVKEIIKHFLENSLQEIRGGTCQNPRR